MEKRIYQVQIALSIITLLLYVYSFFNQSIINLATLFAGFTLMFIAYSYYEKRKDKFLSLFYGLVGLSLFIVSLMRFING